MNEYTDDELKQKLKVFSKECNELMEMIERKKDIYTIQARYKNLKSAIRNEAHRCRLSSTYKNASEFEKNYYIKSLCEASAEGLLVSTNSIPNQEMFSAIHTCHYKLHKYFRFDENN